MKKQLRCANIIQNLTVGTVQFVEMDKDGKRAKDAIVITIQLRQTAEAGKFTINSDYEFNITPKK